MADSKGKTAVTERLLLSDPNRQTKTVFVEDFEVGATYRVEHFSPFKKKDKGRLCEYLGPSRARGAARVRFLDDDSPGKVDFVDLVRVERQQ
jgi:hypothetical protein